MAVGSTPTRNALLMVDLSLKRAERQAIVHGIVHPYVTAKKDRTILSQYERVRGDSQSILRTVLSPVVTETGRLASGESFVDPFSTNVQNISKKEGFKDPLYRVRDCFIARPGMVLLASDLDKAEAVVAAFESEDWNLYTALIEGQDIHTWVAAHAFHGGNEAAVSKHERQICKNVLYASLYMAGVPTITRTINRDADSLGFRLTEEQTQTVRDTIMELTNLEPWWDRVWQDLMDPSVYGGHRWLENCLGFRRMFYNPDNHKLHKEAVNFFPQSTVAGRIDSVMIQAWEELDEPGEFEVLLQVHDELLFQVKADRVGHYAPIIREMMQSTFRSHGRDVYIPAGLEVGTRWEGYRPSVDGPTNELGRMESYG